MTEHIKSPEIINILGGISTSRATIENRPSHSFYYKVNGESIYYFYDGKIRISAGNILYIPQNETYNFEKISDGDSRYILINFYADIPLGTRPKLFSFSGGDSFYSIFKQMETSAISDGGIAGKFELMSLFFHLLALISQKEKIAYTTFEQKGKIETAVEYMKTHIFDPELKISSLNNMCGVSAPTFRHIFMSQFGVSPRNYVIGIRMSKAKAILESEKCDSISELARAVGYSDPLYFSKEFKKHFGIAPSRLK